MPEVGRVAADALGGRKDLHVHDPQGIPLLAALERAGHGADVQARDRAQPQPSHEEPARTRATCATSSAPKAYESGRARSHHAESWREGKRLTIRLSRPRPTSLPASRCPPSAPSRSGRRSTPRASGHPLGRPVLRRLVHPRAGRRARAQPELPRARAPIDSPGSSSRRGPEGRRRQ